MASLTATDACTVSKAFAPLRGARLALAVSGGSDSLALMHLVADWFAKEAKDAEQTTPGICTPEGNHEHLAPASSAEAEWLSGGACHDHSLDENGGPPIVVLTVDHGLRAASVDEAAQVRAAAHKLGLPHKTLKWTGDKPSSGLQAAARASRYQLMGDFLDAELWTVLQTATRPLARRIIVTAHTRDDQAETFLMRLARGSGVDGLSGIQEKSSRVRVAKNGRRQIDILARPLLGFGRAGLRETLRERNVQWIEDPSNEDDRFERVRWRQLLPGLADHGLTVAALALSARRLSGSRGALDKQVQAFQEQHVACHDGAYASVDGAALCLVDAEIVTRVLAKLLNVFGGRDEPPRLSQVESLVHWLAAQVEHDDGQNGTRTLGGCVISVTAQRSQNATASQIRIFREPGRRGLPRIVVKPGQTILWDERFEITFDNSAPAGLTIHALSNNDWAGLKRQTSGLLGARSTKTSKVHTVVDSAHLPARAAVTLPVLSDSSGKVVCVPYLAAALRSANPTDLLSVDWPEYLGACRFVGLECGNMVQPVYYAPQVRTRT